MSTFSVGAIGPESLPITYTIENDTNLDRTEVVGIMGLFPDDANGIIESQLSNYHFYLSGGRETIGFGVGGSFTTNYQFQTTIPWVPALNAITATSGYIVPGSLELTLYYAGYNPFPTFQDGKIKFTDTPTNSTVGQWIHPAVASSSINYTTGVISVTFNAAYAPAGGKPIRVTYQFANPVNYPTQWTVLRTWPTGKIRQAKGWIGQASGVGMFIPKKIQTITVTPANAQTPEYTRAYLRIGRNPSVNTALPTYAVHASLATALNPVGSYMTSQAIDSNGLDYYAGLLSGQPVEEYAVEDPARNSGKGWMKVIQRRNYHTVAPSQAAFGSLTRDYLSVTSYLYVPHNSRSADLEVRLGNDYQGADPYEQPFTETLGTGTNFQTTFSATMTNVFPNADGQHGHLRKGRVRIYSGSTFVGYDKMGDGILVGEPGAGLTGSVNYTTGLVSCTFSTPPSGGTAITCSYKSYYIKIGTATGVQTLTYTLPSKCSQYGLHVRVGGGASALYEGWDGGSSYGASVGQIVPYAFTTTPPTQIAAGPLTTTTTGTLATNLVPGTVGFFADTTIAGVTSTWFCRDNGSGALSGRNVASGTIDYVTGAFSITFSSTPSASFKLYATYGRTTVARPISGTLTYATRSLSITTSQSVPAGTPIFVSYIRNNLASKDHDPNMHPLGSVGINKWVMLWDGTKFTDIHCEGGPALYTFPGGTTGKYAAVIATGGLIPSGGSDTTVHEHMHDGSSISRLFCLYAGTGASSAEDNTWAAKKLQITTPIPTLDAYNSTRAYGLLEGALRIITPEQNPPAQYQTTKRAYSEDLGRNVPSGAYPNKANQFSCVVAWNSGTPLGAGVGPAYARNGARGHLGWRENTFEGVNSGGALRALHDASIYFLYPQAWQGVRYLYHAAMFPAIRPGAMFWNLANRAKWEDRAYHNYIPTSPSAGVCLSASPFEGGYTYYTQEYLGRGWKHGMGHGNMAVTNGSTRVDFFPISHPDPYGGSVVYDRWYYDWSSADPNVGVGGSFYTQTGTTSVAGKRRIAIEGSYGSYTLTNVFYDSAVGRWAGTLDAAYRGPTAGTVSFGLFNDPRTGQDIVDQRNDPRTFPQVRIGCGRHSYQNGIEGDSSSHQSSWAAFDVWNCTGSWLLWDVSRHLGDWNMTSVKDMKNGGFFQDQMRTCAWTNRTVVTSYTLTKDLSNRAGFEFLIDPVYGAAADRYAEWLRTRWTQWLDRGARGEMDPNGTIATGGKERIKDIRITSTSDKADWYSMAKIGSPNPAYGGGGALVGSTWVGRTEAQVKYDDLGFDYVSIWEQGYMMPWMCAAYRELRFDTTPVRLPIRGEPDAPFSSVMKRIFDGYVAFACDYAYLKGVSNVTERGAPGFLAVSVPGNGDPRLAFGTLNWAYRWGPNLSAVGTPISFIQNPANSSAINKTFDQITWPTSANSYIAQQIYWLRGAARSFTGVNDGIDRLGHPLIGRGGFTSYEGGWHDAGVGFVGDPMVPSAQTNPVDLPNDAWPIVRAPARGEAFNMVGRTWSSPENLLWSVAPFMMQIARFATNPVRKAEAGDILNRLLWQSRAISLISGIYDQTVNESSQGDAIESNYFMGPITGDFPYSTDSGGQPINRWWDPSYTSRRKISSGTTHTAHIAGQDVFKINLTSFGIPARILQQDGSDVRIVRQLIDGTNQVCKSVVRISKNGVYNMFAVPPVDIPTGQSIPATSTTEAWYIYYGNSSSGQASWVNTNSIDGPFSVDASTRVLWNQNGNYTTDAGPNNWPLSTFSLLEPDYEDGIFGGSVSINRNNFDVAFSQPAYALALQGDPNYLGSSFAFDFFFNVSPTGYEIDQAGNYGLFSLAGGNSFPILCYVEGVTGRLILSSSVGGSASGYTIQSLSTGGPTRVVIATADGGTNDFVWSLGSAVTPGSVSIVTEDLAGRVEAVDDGTGNFVASGAVDRARSSIDYSTGSVEIYLSSTPAADKEVVIYYTTDDQSWSPGGFNHCRLTYNGSRMLLVVNGVSVGTVACSGVIQPIAPGTVTGIALGAFFTPETSFLAQSVVKLAEFRVSNTDRGLPYAVTKPVMVTMLGEETTATPRTTQASVIGFVAPNNSATASVNSFVALAKTDAVTAAVDMLMLTGVNLQVTQSAIGHVVVSGTTGSSVSCTVATDAIQTTGQVIGNVSALNSSSAGVACLLVFPPVQTTAVVDCRVIAVYSLQNSVSCYVSTSSPPVVQDARCAVVWPNAVSVPASVVGAVQTTSRFAWAQVDTLVLASYQAASRADCTVATGLIDYVRNQAIGSVLAATSQSAAVAGYVAGPSGTTAQATTIGQVSIYREALATVALDVFADGGTGQTQVSAVGSVSREGLIEVKSVDLTVAVPRLYQSGFVLGYVQNGYAANAIADCAIQIQNLSLFQQADCAVNAGSANATAQVVGMLSQSRMAFDSVVTSVALTDLTTSAVVNMRVFSETISIIGQADMSVLVQNAGLVSTLVEGQVVFARQATATATVNFADLWVVPARCDAFIFAGIMDVFSPCVGYVATTSKANAAVTTTVARTRSKNATVRCQVVLPPASRLSASAVSTTTPKESQ